MGLGIPDARGPARYLWWLVRSQAGRVCRGALWSILWMVGLMLPPYLVSRAIDDGLRTRNLGVLGTWAAVILAVGVLSACLGIFRHRTMTFVRMDASFRTIRAVIRHATRLGAALAREVSAGEVVSIGAADVTRISMTLTITGPGVASVIAYAVVTVLLLSISQALAAVVLLGVPVLAALLVPLLRRLQVAETGYRDRQGELTARAGDIVAGLRVLRGIGGKEMFAERYRVGSRALQAEGYRVGAVTSWIEALAVGLPGLFLAGVTWLAARMAAAGAITVGEMVAVYAYVAVLVVPVFFFIEGAGDLGRGLVAARRVIRILNMRPEDTAEGVRGPTGPADLHDLVSDLLVPAGTMVVATGDAVDRLARYVESDTAWGGVPLSKISLDEVRRRIVVADNDAHLFAGSVREAVATRDDHDNAAITAAVHIAAAEDVIAGLPDGLESHLDADARNLSGGQRQRLRLVRAILADPDVLVLVEPTSAVDTHTEALIAERVRAARKGRTTVVVSTSPLWLNQADR